MARSVVGVERGSWSLARFGSFAPNSGVVAPRRAALEKRRKIGTGWMLSVHCNVALVHCGVAVVRDWYKTCAVAVAAGNALFFRWWEEKDACSGMSSRSAPDADHKHCGPAAAMQSGVLEWGGVSWPKS